MRTRRVLALVFAIGTMLIGCIFLITSFREENKMLADGLLMYAILLWGVLAVLALTTTVAGEINNHEGMRNTSLVLFILILLIMLLTSILIGHSQLIKINAPPIAVYFSIMLVFSGIFRIAERVYTRLNPLEKRYHGK